VSLAVFAVVVVIWVVLGGRWWLAAVGAGLLLAGYLLTLAALGWRRARRRRTGPGASGVPRVTAAATV
jgi:hypothetical protein